MRGNQTGNPGTQAHTENRNVTIPVALQPTNELSAVQHCLSYGLDRTTEVGAKHVVGVRGSGTAALEVIGHGDLDNRDAALGEKAGNPAIPGQCIPVVKNHQGLIEGPAVGDFCPDNVVLGNIGGNIRRTREPFALSFKTLIVATRFVEKG